MVVRLSVGVVRCVVEVECDIKEVDDLEVSLDCDVQSVSFKIESFYPSITEKLLTDSINLHQTVH